MLNKCYLSIIASILVVSQASANTTIYQSTASIIAKARTGANLVVVNSQFNPDIFNTNYIANLSNQSASSSALTTIRQIAYFVNHTANNLMVAASSTVVSHTRLVIAGDNQQFDS